jgi:hypothetical protein
LPKICFRNHTEDDAAFSIESSSELDFETRLNKWQCKRGFPQKDTWPVRHTIFRLAVTGFIVLVAYPVAANSLLRQIDRTGLTQQDLNIMVRKGGELYANRAAQPGDDTIWSNPETGAYGSAEITSVSGSCVGLNYKFRTRRQPEVQVVRTRRCLTNGRWVLAP